MNNQQSLTETFAVINSELINRRIELVNPCDMVGFFGAMEKHVPRTMNCEIKLYKGKKTRQYAHIVIEWLDSGWFEPILYVL